MAAVYNLEPQPTAKCVLHTTSGDVLLELFAQQTPVTSRNFLQLCLDGYYDNTIFHRLVPGFIIQGGDPTGTGSGGSSSYDGGRPFADEFHSRLKFNRRGLLGMANTGTKDDNGSQFFLTLGKTEELTGRNTMFGRVEGDTIFNLVRMGEADLTEEDGSERPMYPTKITSTEVLVNPFEGMEKRNLTSFTSRQDGKQEKKKTVKKKLAKGLLSFGGEDGEEDTGSATVAKPKFNPKFANGFENGSSGTAIKRSAPDAAREHPRKRRATSSRSPSPSPVPENKPSRSATKSVPSRSPSPSVSPEPAAQAASTSALERANAQIAELKNSLKRNVVAAPQNHAQKKSALESMIPATAIRGRKRKPGGSSSALGGTMSKEDQRALDQFNAFKKRLDAASTAVPTRTAREELDEDIERKRRLVEEVATGGSANANQDEDEEATLCDLHFVPNCQSCRKWDEEDAEQDAADDGDDDKGWLTHRLTFEKDRLGKDLEWKRQNEKELVVIDPREREKEIREERKKGKGRGR